MLEVVLDLCARGWAWGAGLMMTPLLTVSLEAVEEDGVFRHPYLVLRDLGGVGHEEWLPIPEFAICRTPLPAYFCTCGRYALFEEDSEESWD
jgi:hypothetical protein